MEKLIINTADIRSNIDAVRKYSSVQLIGVVDHGGYGCGSRFLARAFVSAGVQMLAASDAATVNTILNDFPQVNTLLMCPVIGRAELDCIVRRGAVATVTNSEDAARLNAAAEESGSIIKAHLLIRTHKDGCGISLSQADRVAATLLNCHNIEVDGAYTHIDARRRTSEKAVLVQKEIFEQTAGIINTAGVQTPLLHMAESYTALRYPDLSFNAVRVGDAIIGRMEEKDKWHLAPVGEIETTVIGFTVIPAEDEKSLKTSKERRYALVDLSSIGSARAASPDGLIPFADKQLYCIWGKKKLRVVGNCGSELLLVDTARAGVQTGDTVRFSADPRLVGADCERNYE